TESFTGVLDERETVAVADRPQLVQLARVAEDVDGHDRLRSLRDGCLSGARVEVQRPWIDVGEHRGRTRVDGAVRRRGEGVRRGDHLVAWADAGDVDREVEAGGSARDGSAVRRSDRLRDQRLEARARRTEGEPARTQHLEDELLVALVEPG